VKTLRTAAGVVGAVAAAWVSAPGCGDDAPVPPGGSYWPATDGTRWLMEGRWQDLSGHNQGGATTVETYIAGTDYDSQGRPVKVWVSSETDGRYFFRVDAGEVWANWAETDPKAEYYLWLKLPPEDGQSWEDEKYRVAVSGPFHLGVPFGDFDGVYRVRYDYVEEPGHYEVWWYAAGVGCIEYEHYIPDIKHELLWLVDFTAGA